MPSEMGFDYMGMSYQEQKARQGVSSWVIFGFSFVFLCFSFLAALYESWSLPFSVLLSTPVAVFGAVAALWLRHVLLGAFVPAYMVQLEIDVYLQIALVMLIGLGAKNSILIVAFAKEEYERGKPLVEAARRGEDSVSASHDDGARLYRRLHSAMDRIRRWIHRAPDHRHSGNRRHGGGNVSRQILSSRHLCRGREVVGR